MIYEWPIRVFYEDTDAGGVVYHARYVAFFERARTEILRDMGISQRELFSESVAFAVRSMNIDFHKPALLDDLLLVKTRIDKIRKASITFHQSLFDEKGELLCEATVLVASIDLVKMKARSLPSCLKLELEKLESNCVK